MTWIDSGLYTTCVNNLKLMYLLLIMMEMTKIFYMRILTGVSFCQYKLYNTKMLCCRHMLSRYHNMYTETLNKNV